MKCTVDLVFDLFWMALYVYALTLLKAGDKLFLYINREVLGARGVFDYYSYVFLSAF